MQLAFDFSLHEPWRPKRPERLFFGLLPDAETAARVARIRDRFLREHGLEGRRTSTDRLHVSLHHVGDYGRLRSAFVYAAREAAKAVSLPPFEMSFGLIRSFEDIPSVGDVPRRQPLVLLGEGEAASHLHQALGAAMVRNGLRAGQSFTPHMTLLYGITPVPARKIEPVRLAVRDFALIHSKLGLTQYEVIGRWPLSA